MSTINLQADSLLTELKFSFEDTTSGSSFDAENLIAPYPLSKKLVNGTSAIILGFLLFNPAGFSAKSADFLPEPGASSILMRELADLNENTVYHFNEDTELDSPNWLSGILTELHERNYVRVNDPRNRTQ